MIFSEKSGLIENNSKRNGLEQNGATVLFLIVVLFILLKYFPCYGKYSIYLYSLRFVFLMISLLAYLVVLFVRTNKEGVDPLLKKRNVIQMIFGLILLLYAWGNLSKCASDILAGPVTKELTKCSEKTVAKQNKYSSTKHYLRGHYNGALVEISLMGINRDKLDALKGNATDVVVTYYEKTGAIKNLEIINIYEDYVPDMTPIERAKKTVEQLTAEDMESELSDNGVALRKALYNPLGNALGKDLGESLTADDMVHVYYNNELVYVIITDYDIIKEISAEHIAAHDDVPEQIIINASCEDGSSKEFIFQKLSNDEWRPLR